MDSNNIVAFPKLGLEFNLHREAFNIFGLSIQWYGVIIAVGFMLALCYALLNSKKFGLDSDRVIDAIIGGIIGGVIGARLYFVLFTWEDYKDDLWSIFNIRGGGLAMYGGLIGAVLVGGLVCKWRKVKFFPMLDMAGLGFLIGQGIGRWGNFVNVEAYGTNTTLPWGMTATKIQSDYIYNMSEYEKLGIAFDPSASVHPTFLYESLWCILGFVLLHFYFKHRKFDGEIFTMYIGWNGLGRFFIEGMRTDSLLLGKLRVSQVLAALMVLGAAAVLLTIYSKIKRYRVDDSDYLKLYVYTEESKLILEEAQKQRDEAKTKKEQSVVTEDNETVQEPEEAEVQQEQDEQSDQQVTGEDEDVSSENN
ncbi:MAG: prolipoprotein diacylglyceryl transferase [Oscillospiraceae bacterium]|jgi:phosphatidylglycerol:prolipoprotein diacylglycerol transferase|nr:prolipoprotein diacylglyceryl transferase [Oscillospiraceae bacterium]